MLFCIVVLSLDEPQCSISSATSLKYPFDALPIKLIPKWLRLQFEFFDLAVIRIAKVIREDFVNHFVRYFQRVCSLNKIERCFSVIWSDRCHVDHYHSSVSVISSRYGDFIKRNLSPT